MTKYSKESIYLSAFAKLPTDMPSGGMYKAVDIGLVINPELEVVEDASITLLTDESVDFLKQIMVGYNLSEDGVDSLLETIKMRYFGTSQKAICVALKLVYEKYSIWKKENKVSK